MKSISRISHSFEGSSTQRYSIEVEEFPVAEMPAYDEHTPLDSGIINVEDHGIVPDQGVIPASAITDLLSEAAFAGPPTRRRLYFPQAGTYEFDGKLEPPGNHSNIIFRGASRDGTVIRLAPGSVGFEDPHNKRTPFIQLRSQTTKADAFGNGIEQCTVEIGERNPGAIGVDFYGNNYSEIRNVRFRAEDGRGFAGIGYQFFPGSLPGPNLVKHAIIEGFDYGIATKELESGGVDESVTLEDVEIWEPNVAGIHIYNSIAFQIRGLKYRGRAPAVFLRGSFAQFIMLDSDLQWTGEDGDPKTEAIWLRGPVQQNPSTMLLRNVTHSGWSSALREECGIESNFMFSKGSPRGLPSPISEHLHPPGSGFAFGGSGGTLGLPVKETPEIQVTEPTEFASIEAFGASQDPFTDSSAAVQAAIDSGKKVVYLNKRHGVYGLASPVVLRGDVEKIASYGDSGFIRIPPYTGPLFVLEDGSSPAVEIFGISVRDYPGNAVNHPTHIHASSRDFVIKRCQRSWYAAQDGCGDVYIEDCPVNRIELSANNLWSRQLNMEDGGSSKLINAGGGDVWILGMKTENPGANVHIMPGGRAEILGGYGIHSGDPTPWWLNENGQICIMMTTPTYESIPGSTPIIREIVGTATVDITKGQVSLPGRPGMLIPLYTGQKP